MKSFRLATVLALAQGVWAQFTVQPDTPADPNTIKDCTWWHVAAAGETCASIAAGYSLSRQQFATYVSLGLLYHLQHEWP